MKRSDLNQKLSKADASGVWAFTPSSFSALMGGIEPGYLKLMTKRLSDQGVLIRAARASTSTRMHAPGHRTRGAALYASFDRGRSAM
jgi:hypothetical protein